MAIESASRELVRKPWGSVDLRPWSKLDTKGEAVGEIWFGRADGPPPPEPALLLKLLFTRERLSIQVHPDDTFARSAGLANGKTEAWYVLAAERDARVALGLSRKITLDELRSSMSDGSIADLVAWRTVEAAEAFLVPAGTIHAIGAGLVIAEIQQRSDTTYRIFDFGRRRNLHVEETLAVADTGPPLLQALPVVLTATRTLLAKSPYFVLERINLSSDSNWWVNLGCEAWLLVISGKVRIGDIEAGAGEVIYLDEDHAKLQAAPDGVRCLLAYSKPEPIANLLEKPQHAFPQRGFAPSNADQGANLRLPVRSPQALS